MSRATAAVIAPSGAELMIDEIERQLDAETAARRGQRAGDFGDAPPPTTAFGDGPVQLSFGDAPPPAVADGTF